MALKLPALRAGGALPPKKIPGIRDCSLGLRAAASIWVHGKKSMSSSGLEPQTLRPRPIERHCVGTAYVYELMVFSRQSVFRVWYCCL
jgi:hypothetical protein